MPGIPQIQCWPTPKMWEGRYGLADEDRIFIADEGGVVLWEDQNDLPSSPPLTGLYGWYKADAYSYGNGDVAALPINDASGQANHLNDRGNHSPPFEPHFYTNVLNGLPVLRFDQADTVFRFLTSTPASGYTVAVVVRKRTHNGAFPSMIFTGGTQATAKTLQWQTTPTEVTFVGTGNATNVSLTVPLDTWQIVTFTYDATEGIPRLRTNDATAAGAASAGAANLDYLFLQSASVTEIAEALNYNRALADDELATLRLYLGNKWGISITV